MYNTISTQDIVPLIYYYIINYRLFFVKNLHNYIVAN